ncbi:MAG: ABC transporter permease [Ardenticatenaceae bacterium]|nr:ABC transporter permease [Ardenticatenaceae bacterium]
MDIPFNPHKVMAPETKPISQDYYFYDASAGTGSLLTRLKTLAEFRYLLGNLVIRDIKARYKNSVLGILWSMLNPLGLMIVFTAVFSVMGRGQDYRQYPVFVLVGIVPWNFFSGSLSTGAVTVISNSSLVKKVYFPRELLPIASLLSNLVNFLFTFLVLIIFIYAFGIGLTVHALWVPVILATQLIFTLGITLFLSSVSVFFRDILMILDVGLTAWFFMTPIIYPFEFFSESSSVLGITFNPAQIMRWLNPMASIIDSYRTVLWGTQGSTGPVSMDPIFLLRTFLTAVLVLIIGYAMFIRTEHLFGEKL